MEYARTLDRVDVVDGDSGDNIVIPYKQPTLEREDARRQATSEKIIAFPSFPFHRGPAGVPRVRHPERRP